MEKLCRCCAQTFRTLQMIDKNFFEESTGVSPKDDVQIKVCKKCKLKIDDILQFREYCKSAQKIFEDLSCSTNTDAPNISENMTRSSIKKKIKTNERQLRFEHVDTCVKEETESNFDDNGSEEVLSIKIEDIKQENEKNSGKSNSSNERSVCPICKAYVVNLKQHSDKSHKPKFKYKCSRCTVKNYYNLNYSNIKDHMDKNHSLTKDFKEFKCSICDSYFEHHVRLIRHIQDAHRIHKNNVKNHVERKTIFLKNYNYLTNIKSILKNYNWAKCYCGLCGKKCLNKIHLNSHINLEHRDLKMMKQFNCRVCKTHVSFYRHHLYLHLIQRHQRNINLKKLRKKEALITKVKKKLIYKKCISYKIRYTKTLNYNIENEKPYKCPQCERRYGFASNLRQHLKQKHPSYHIGVIEKHPIEKNKIKIARANWKKRTKEENKSYQCHTCGKVYKSSSSLRNHKLTHDSTQQYQCQICGSTLKSKINFKKHLLKHGGEKPFKCTVEDCTKAYTLKAQLKQHLKAHQEGWKKTFKCTICGSYKRSPAELKIHIMIHNDDRPFKCSMCEKSFVTQPKLNTHFRSHTGEKKYKCNECDKAFSRPFALNVHYDQCHCPDEKKKISCDICVRKFLSIPIMKKHRKGHGKIAKS